MKTSCTSVILSPLFGCPLRHISNCNLVPNLSAQTSINCVETVREQRGLLLGGQKNASKVVLLLLSIQLSIFNTFVYRSLVTQFVNVFP